MVAETTHGQPYVQVIFAKTHGNPESEYKLIGIAYNDDGNNTAAKHYVHGVVGSIQQTATGTWSGTFAGERSIYPDPGPAAITQGVFVGAKL